MNKEQAHELCGKFGVKPSEHPALIVTNAGNIYLNGNVDPTDNSGVVDMSEEKEAQKTEDEPGKRKKKS